MWIIMNSDYEVETYSPHTFKFEIYEIWQDLRRHLRTFWTTKFDKIFVDIWGFAELEIHR